VWRSKSTNIIDLFFDYFENSIYKMDSNSFK
jgi:hypothetical protein